MSITQAFVNGETLRAYCQENHVSIAEAMQRREVQTSERGRAEIREEMYKNLVVMRESVYEGLTRKQQPVSGLTGGDAHLLFKYGKAIVFNFATVVVFKLLGNIEAVQRWIPSYIGEGTYLLAYTGDKLLLNGVLGLGVLFGYALVLTGINYLVYKHMDLAR